MFYNSLHITYLYIIVNEIFKFYFLIHYYPFKGTLLILECGSCISQFGHFYKSVLVIYSQIFLHFLC